MSIRNKFIFIIAFALVAVAAGTVVAAHLFAARGTDSVFAETAATHMDRVEDLVQAYFAAGTEAVKTLAELPETKAEDLLRENGANGNGGTGGSGANGANAAKAANEARAAARAALAARLEMFRSVVPGAEAVFSCYKTGLCLSSPESAVAGTEASAAPGSAGAAGAGASAGAAAAPDSEPVPENDLRKNAWYSDTALGASPVTVADAYISGVTKSLAATVAAKIQNDAGETIGVAALNLSLASLSDTLRDIQPGKSGHLVIFDGKGRIILDPKRQESLLRPAASSSDGAIAALARMPAGIHSIKRGNAEYAVYIRSLSSSPGSPGPRWKAAVLLDKTVLHGAANTLTLNTALVGLALLCAAFALAAVAAISATRPLEALIKQSSALADGNTEALAGIPGRGPDITLIHGNFGRLTGRILLMLQAEKERMEESRRTAVRYTEVERETLNENKNLRETYLARHKKIAQAIAPVTAELAAALRALDNKTLEAKILAEKQFITADEVHHAAMTALNGTVTFARQATETEANADASLSLAADLGVKIEETARGIESAGLAAASLSGNLESMKTDVADIAQMANALRELAEQANLLGFNVAVDATSANGAEKDLADIVAKIRAIAENAMTVAGTVDAVTASLEQQHATQTQALTKALTAIKRAAAGSSKTKQTAGAAISGSATTVEQFRVLATALEGAAYAGTENTEHTDALFHAARDMTDLLQEIGKSIGTLTALSARLAATATELEEDGTDPA